MESDDNCRCRKNSRKFTSYDSPEKEPLKFDSHTVINAPDEVQRLIENIKHVSSHFLFKWKVWLHKTKLFTMLS